MIIRHRTLANRNNRWVSGDLVCSVRFRAAFVAVRKTGAQGTKRRPHIVYVMEFIEEIIQAIMCLHASHYYSSSTDSPNILMQKRAKSSETFIKSQLRKARMRRDLPLVYVPMVSAALVSCCFPCLLFCLWLYIRVCKIASRVKER